MKDYEPPVETLRITVTHLSGDVSFRFSSYKFTVWILNAALSQIKLARFFILIAIYDVLYLALGKKFYKTGDSFL